MPQLLQMADEAPAAAAAGLADGRGRVPRLLPIQLLKLLLQMELLFGAGKVDDCSGSRRCISGSRRCSCRCTTYSVQSQVVQETGWTSF